MMRDPLHLQREIGDTAAAMLAGSISFIAGARHICTICFEAGLEKDPDILRLRGIDSETDSLPIGAATRSQWSEEALAGIASDIERAQSWACQVGTEACRNLVSRYLKPDRAGANLARERCP
jgi:hypothetical protein